MSDPIAGQRQAINAGDVDALTFPYFDPETKTVLPCPVERGQVFELRDCRITLGTPERMGKHGAWQWRVPFIRTKRVSADRVRLLSKRGGYTEDDREALNGADAPLDDHWREVPENLGPPPEPEAIDPEVVATLPSTVAARVNYEREQAERREAFRRLPLSERVRRLEQLDPARVGRQLARIEEATSSAERKLRRHGRSDEAAA